MTTFHTDRRYITKTLPTMAEGILRYPLLCWRVSKEYYLDVFRSSMTEDQKSNLPPPNFVGDYLILIKGGNNRYEAARDLGYTSIDCLVFDNQRDSILWTRYLEQCDPLKNSHLPFLGLVEYK